MRKLTGNIDPRTRKQLVKLVQDILDADGSEEEQDRNYELLHRVVLHPEASDLIYYNDNPDITAEEIVEEFQAYRPIHL